MPKLKEIRDMSDDLLAEHAGTVRRELFNLRFQHATGELESSARLREARRELARTLTIARERRIDIETGRAAE